MSAANKALVRLIVTSVGWSFFTNGWTPVWDARSVLDLQDLAFWLTCISNLVLGAALAWWGTFGIIKAFQRSDRADHLERALDTFDRATKPIFDANRRDMERR
jgi:hypothetical protein